MKLLNRQSYTVKRQNQDTSYIDDDGNWITPEAEVETFTVKGNRQPFRNGLTQVILPEGVESNDAFLFYSHTQLLPADELTEQVADIMLINGIEHECFRMEDWTGYGLKTDHYKHVFIRADKN